MNPNEQNRGDLELNQNQRGLKPQYKFSPDEVRVLKECNRESFYQRCLPIAAALGFTTYYGVKSGYLSAHKKFGAVPKVAVSAIVGYFIGKFSYQSKCAEKLMQLPNSQFGEILRRRRQGNYQESLEPGFGPGVSLGPFSGISPNDTYSDLGPGNVDSDSPRPSYDGLDDSHRPSLDNPNIYEEEMPPIQKSVTTYDDLRKQNREEYQQRRTGNYREPVRVPSPTSAPPPSAIPDSLKNKYGDNME